MSEIAKLYKNAGVEPKAKCISQACIVTNPHKNWCNKCESLDYDYPPFTAEKQLSLIKWLMVNNKDYQYDIEDNKYWFIIDDYRETKYREFDEALAELINLYWQDLTEQERTEIADILKG